MALLHRLSRLLSADLHAVMDRLEDPLVLLQQAQRDMTDAIAEQQWQLEALQASCSDLTRRLQQADARSKTLTEELNLCLDDDNDALARGVIRRQLLLRADIERDTQTLSLRSASVEQLQADIQRQQQALNDVVAEAERLATQERYALSAAETAAGTAPVTDEAIELALLAERRARGGAS